jgi:predicted house-cleaning noncanonical NTP pyrophosphatase (MazG superfamily)/inosine/xanthosine triphosphate pyrophosphatase family protein
MKSFIFKKLVRDKITKHMLDNNQKPYGVKILSDKEYLSELIEKLLEEASELREAKGQDDLLEEFADVLEIIKILKDLLNAENKIKEIKKKKNNKNGSFQKRIFIEGVNIDESNKWFKYYKDNPDKYPIEDSCQSFKKHLLIATGNKDKFDEFSELFNEFGFMCAIPPVKVDIDENLPTLMGNARKKAIAYSNEYPFQLVFATDGGTKIPFLGEKWNHVLTKRLSGLDMEEELTDKKRCEILLELMNEAKDEERKVLWQEAFVIALNGKVIYSFEAQSPPGYLLREIPDNFQESGYWIGYLWHKPEFDKTYMELTKKEKKEADTVSKYLRNDLRENLDKVFKSL